MLATLHPACLHSVMNLIQIRENEWINLDAITSVRVIEREDHSTTELPHNQRETKKIGEHLSLKLTMAGGSEVLAIQPFADKLYDALFPDGHSD